MKESLKEKAIQLRKAGSTYSEILRSVPVAKSTISLWLRSVGLSVAQRQKLTQKKLEAAKRGGEARKRHRIQLTERILREAAKEVGKITPRELWLIGAMLYWAEGSKEKEGNYGVGVQFTNSDPHMVKLFLKWLTDVCKVPKGEIYFDIFIHENSKNSVEQVKKYWSSATNFSEHHFPHLYFKRNKVKTNRKNVGESYFGLVKVRVRASSILNRKIAGWTRGVIECAI